MSGRTSPIPRDTPVLDENGLITLPWDNWLTTEVQTRLDNSPHRIVTKTLVDQGAAIGTTSLPVPVASAGLFRVSYIIRQTRVATGNASLQVTLGWTRGTGQTDAGAALTTNLLTTHESRSLLIRRDVSTAITFAVAYSSAGATSAEFEIDLVIEAL